MQSDDKISRGPWPGELKKTFVGVYYTQITDFGLDFPIIYTFKKAKSIN
jgi:hypothetical protein